MKRDMETCFSIYNQNFTSCFCFFILWIISQVNLRIDMCEIANQIGLHIKTTKKNRKEYLQYKKHFIINGQKYKRVNYFKYLGTQVNN